MKTFLTIFLTAAIAVTATWFFLDRRSGEKPATPEGAREVLY